MAAPGPEEMANQKRGYKATLSNPNVSDEAKKHAEMILKSGELDSAEKLTEEGEKNPGNVAGGLKAAINNPRVSDEAKEAAQEKLDNM